MKTIEFLSSVGDWVGVNGAAIMLAVVRFSGGGSYIAERLINRKWGIMHAVDSHIHWWPVEYYRFLERRSSEPRAERRDGRWIVLNGIRTMRNPLSPEWFDLDMQFETVAKTGHDMTLLCSAGIHSDLDGLPPEEACEAARILNEGWSDMQRRYPGKFFAAAVLPLQDTEKAVDEVQYATTRLGLRGVSLPGSVDGEPLDAPRLEPVYAHIEELGLPIFIHPTDGVFVRPMLGDAYGNMIYMSLGRVVDSSTGVLRLILSGILDRHPTLKIVHFHAGGVLPFAAGRLDKNARSKDIEEMPSSYLKRMWVDTAMPHALTIRMALEFYGADRVLYGSDNPCWNPRGALNAIESLKLPQDVMKKILSDNVHSIVNLESDVLERAR